MASTGTETPLRRTTQQHVRQGFGMTPVRERMERPKSPSQGSISSRMTGTGNLPPNTQRRRRYNDTRELDVVASEMAAYRAARKRAMRSPYRSGAMTPISPSSASIAGFTNTPTSPYMGGPHMSASYSSLGRPMRPWFQGTDSALSLAIDNNASPISPASLEMIEGMTVGVRDSPYPAMARRLDLDTSGMSTHMAMTSTPSLLGASPDLDNVTRTKLVMSMREPDQPTIHSDLQKKRSFLNWDRDPQRLTTHAEQELPGLPAHARKDLEAKSTKPNATSSAPENSVESANAAPGSVFPALPTTKSAASSAPVSSPTSPVQPSSMGASPGTSAPEVASPHTRPHPPVPSKAETQETKPDATPTAVSSAPASRKTPAQPSSSGAPSTPKSPVPAPTSPSMPATQPRNVSSTQPSAMPMSSNSAGRSSSSQQPPADKAAESKRKRNFSVLFWRKDNEKESKKKQDKAQKEQAAKEKLEKDKQSKEQATKNKLAREQEARDKALKDKLAKEQSAKEKANKSHLAREENTKKGEANKASQSGTASSKRGLFGLGMFGSPKGPSTPKRAAPAVSKPAAPATTKPTVSGAKQGAPATPKSGAPAASNPTAATKSGAPAASNPAAATRSGALAPSKAADPAPVPVAEASPFAPPPSPPNVAVQATPLDMTSVEPSPATTQSDANRGATKANNSFASSDASPAVRLFTPSSPAPMTMPEQTVNTYEPNVSVGSASVSRSYSTRLPWETMIDEPSESVSHASPAGPAPEPWRSQDTAPAASESLPNSGVSKASSSVTAEAMSPASTAMAETRHTPFAMPTLGPVATTGHSDLFTVLSSPEQFKPPQTAPQTQVETPTTASFSVNTTTVHPTLSPSHGSIAALLSPGPLEQQTSGPNAPRFAAAANAMPAATATVGGAASSDTLGTDDAAHRLSPQLTQPFMHVTPTSSATSTPAAMSQEQFPSLDQALSGGALDPAFGDDVDPYALMSFNPSPHETPRPSGQFTPIETPKRLPNMSDGDTPITVLGEGIGYGDGAETVAHGYQVPDTPTRSTFKAAPHLHTGGQAPRAAA